MTRAVVFAYHDVGVRCLRVLLQQGVTVPLVVTHLDAPGEEIWFESVAQHARWHRIEVATPSNCNAPEFVELVRAARPDFLFSFYYRQLLGEALLATASGVAYNMHGSLLPKYRGRAPVNWAVLNGERESGATLHAMTTLADAGGIVDAQAVPVLGDDTAIEVFRKVSVAAELILARALPGLLAGTTVLQTQRLDQGSYFGRRTPADGAINWQLGVAAVHNLVRSVAPPYPGAYAQAAGLALRILRTLPAEGPRAARAELRLVDGEVQAVCPDGTLRLLEFELDGKVRDAAAFRARFGAKALPLTDGQRNLQEAAGN